MAVPKGRVSKAKKHSRRANWKLAVPGMITCPKCQAFKMPHRVCKQCGSYNGREVIAVKEAK